MPDQICIHQLKLSARLGVTDAERAQPQPLTVNLVCFPKAGCAALDDRIENAADYAAICARVEQVVALRPRNLLETVAEDIATALLARFPLAAVDIEVRKYVVPATDYVAIRIQRP
jgi:dihydroneopterin aldolase